MAESPLGGGHQYHSHEAGSPINCPSGCKLRHKPETDLNQASCDCEEGYYDREQRVFYTGSDVRNKKSPETRQQYLERIEGTDADPKKNNQGDYFVPGDGIRYEVLRSLKEEIFGERAQIWKHELNGQRGWLIRADRRRYYDWPTIIGRLQQQSQSQDTPDRVRRPPDPRPAISGAGPSGTRPTSGYPAALTTTRHGTPSYSSQSATGPSYIQVAQTFDLAGIGSAFPASPQGNPYAPSITPQSSAPNTETRSYAISRQSAAQPGQDVRRSMSPQSPGQDVHVPNYIPTSRRPREAQPLTTEGSDGRPERTSQYTQSSNDRSVVPRVMTDSTEESTSRRGGSEITSSLPTRQKGTTVDEKQKRKHRKG
ncbi:hypothetical protein Z517_06898 [Fonsecaea pedrosoi CBS 271.37]|uniref:Unplaced genomic scaffold supercont1.4, whole genome shotgun sequence n=1 Tax=Fonsecaea pedrosoi CBS 271.37 TaxID=1442368 RepID=A0A0D2GHK2_9EURO|nr:uncharacterized protein Z517_06898 [Fonsecaea pedrosoi CBS 271.37]KIW80283.1 hypothetical protein Z517_06898 [Fonsecaea pedrosoi CBS 271.37]